MILFQTKDKKLLEELDEFLETASDCSSDFELDATETVAAGSASTDAIVQEALNPTSERATTGAPPSPEKKVEEPAKAADAPSAKPATPEKKAPTPEKGAAAPAAPAAKPEAPEKKEDENKNKNKHKNKKNQKRSSPLASMARFFGLARKDAVVVDMTHDSSDATTTATAAVVDTTPACIRELREELEALGEHSFVLEPVAV